MKWRLGSARHVKPVRENVLQTVRRGMLANVSGDVIELGAGDGKSLPYYPYQNLDSLTLVDARFSRSVHKQDMRQVPVTFVSRRLDDLPFGRHSFDYACLFFVLSATTEPYRVLAALRRTMRPGGRLLFIDYLRPVGPTALLYDGVNLVHRLATRGNSSLSRNVVSILEVSGFRVVSAARCGSMFVYGEAELV